MTTLFGEIEPQHDQEFHRFWTEYPRKVAKQAALVAWRRLNPSATTRAAIFDALDWQRTQATWIDQRGRFVPHAATWLNQRRWEDERPQDARRFESFVDASELVSLLGRAGVNTHTRLEFFQNATLAESDDALVLTIPDAADRAYVSRNFFASIQEAAKSRGMKLVLR